MRILVANDDGINARGLALLEAIAHKMSEDVWVVAPDSERSWTGRSHTAFAPLRAQEAGDKRWVLSGTPADCVMFGLRTLMKHAPPDLVLSGINHGSNLGEEVGYSGTLAAAMEGSVAGVRSIGLSQLYNRETRSAPWQISQHHAESVIRRLIDLAWSADIVMAVNLPALDNPTDVQGIRFTHLARNNVGTGDYVDEQRLDPHGRAYYWTGFKPNFENADPDSDVGAVAEGYISICPLHLDMTHCATLKQLRAV